MELWAIHGASCCGGGGRGDNSVCSGITVIIDKHKISSGRKVYILQVVDES